MLAGRKRSSSSFGSDGRRVGAPFRRPTKALKSSSCSNPSRKSSKLFQSGCNISVLRAPALGCLSVPSGTGIHKKFQRPMTKRRAYNKTADQALKKSSLGTRRRMDGMAKLMARAGRGLTFKLPSKPNSMNGSDDSCDESDEEKDKENEKPFEPLLVWTSPHQGGEPIGLPPRMMTEKRADEHGVEESVTLLKPAPLASYAKQNVFVPPVLAKWLRPHQREGMSFLYDCVMGLKPYNGRGCM